MNCALWWILICLLGTAIGWWCDRVSESQQFVVVPTSITIWLVSWWTTHPHPDIELRRGNKMMPGIVKLMKGMMRRMSNHKSSPMILCVHSVSQSVSRYVAICSLHWAQCSHLMMMATRTADCLRRGMYLPESGVLVLIRSSFELPGRTEGPEGGEEKSIWSQIPINWRNVMEYLIYESGSERT